MSTDAKVRTFAITVILAVITIVMPEPVKSWILAIQVWVIIAGAVALVIGRVIRRSDERAGWGPIGLHGGPNPPAEGTVAQVADRWYVYREGCWCRLEDEGAP